MPNVPVQKLDTGLPTPTYARPGDAGIDLRARDQAVLYRSGGRALVGTGIAVALPEGCAGLVLPRSGLALNHGVTCLNTPGLIDSGYRGEIKVLLVNTDPSNDYTVDRGERIAQLVVVEIEQVHLVEVDDLEPTARGGRGFGSTGR